MKTKVKCILINIALIAVNSIYCNAQNYVANKDSLAAKRKLKLGISVEFLGMRSLVFQKEPFPYVQPNSSRSGSYVAGYIPKPTYSTQLGVFHTFKLYKSFYIKGGLQLKFTNSKYEKKENWQPPYTSNPPFIYGKSYFLTLTNYMVYKNGSNYFAAGLSILAFDVREIYFSPKSIYNDFPLNKNYLAYVLRYERNIKNMMKSKINLILETESAHRKRDYFQLKIGINYSIN